jgi:single-strand DNA-binding protein
MSNDLNRYIATARLTFDPELRHIPSGKAVCDLRLAVNNSWAPKDGDRREEVLYIDVTVWDKQAENCCNFLRKGSKVLVEGSLKMDTWDDKNTGEKRSKIRVQGERVMFLDGKPSGEGGGGGGNGGYENRSQGQRDNRSQPQASRGGAPSGRGGYSGAPGQGRTPPVTQAEADDMDSVPF